MATKKSTKVSLKKGDYVRVNKKTIGVVVGIDDSHYDSEGNWNDERIATGQVYVASVDQYGDANNADLYKATKLTKIKAPEYVVVWSNEDTDPFCQFETRAEANIFATKLRKDKQVVEVRMYKLTK